MTFGASDNYGIPTCDEGKCLLKINLQFYLAYLYYQRQVSS
jgi:hypothetical protein